ncbi:MAG: SAM-dependent chlorinase/fluorinase [Actinomycetota bacterium]|nr:SAM-dependent chlorinase/fluorinase [Actinomycetota bacterium]
MGTREGAIFLMSDYGVVDEFAGVLRASVARAAPGAPLVDLTHGVPPFDVVAGARALVRCIDHLGPGVVLAVVDPGVGTDRRAVALRVAPGAAARTEVPAGPWALVGPDNGLLVAAAERLGGIREAVALPPVSPAAGAERSTFDGRDVFAPAAGRLWSGASLDSLGEEVDPGDLVRLPEAVLAVGPGSVQAEVLWVDRFGNVQLAAHLTHARQAGLGSDLVVEASARRFAGRLVASFADAGPGQLGVLVDANGHLAVVADRASAATVLGVSTGDVVVVRSGGAEVGAGVGGHRIPAAGPGGVPGGGVPGGGVPGGGVPGGGVPGGRRSAGWTGPEGPTDGEGT